MNESEKNIETCLPESILAEVASVPTDPQFVSLVNESLDPLKQQAFQQAGSDAYNEVVASHKPYTFTSAVVQMKSNLILLLRRLWRFPFGSGTIRSLSDMWEHYINRLQGSETYGIPSRLDQLTDLPSAPLLVADRKISEPNAIDGISLLHQLSDSSVSLTKIEDTNRGWTLDKAYSLERLIALFPALTEIIYGCKYITQSLTNTRSGYTLPEKLSFNGLEECVSAPLITMGEGAFTGNKEMSFPDLKKMGCLVCYNGNGWWTSSISTDTLRFDALEEITSAGGGRGAFIEVPFPNLKKLDLSPVKSMGRPLYGGSCLQGLESLDLSGSNNVNLCHGIYPANISTVLLLLKIKEGFAANLNLQYWSPTLDSSNLQQFLSNFRSFIVLRLANRKSTTALTLTLSANVYNAVTGANSGWASQHTLADLGITDNDLTDLETELGITSATIYASWLDTYTGANGIHWDITDMKHVLIADEGCWLTRVGFTPEQESAPEFWKEVRTSEPEDYTEVTDARRTEMEDAWHESHPDPEPEPSPEPEQKGGEV